jgi:hypothetical protein
MCLYSKTPIPSIAQEDIICYKMFHINPIWDTLLMTPFRLEVVNLEDFPFMFVASSDKCVTPIYSSSCITRRIGYKVGPGFIHAYTRNFSENMSSHYCAVLCKIHKGTKYYVSTDGEEICASQMELIKIIK